MVQRVWEVDAIEISDLNVNLTKFTKNQIQKLVRDNKGLIEENERLKQEMINYRDRLPSSSGIYSPLVEHERKVLEAMLETTY